MITRLSSGPLHHFFGYYGICPWNAAGNQHLALQTRFHERSPQMDDSADVGLIAAESGHFHNLASTRAFNLQQGAMLHWIRATGSEECTFNDWDGDHLVTRAINPISGERRTLAGAIAAVSPRDPMAIGINYARTYACRKVTGYANTLYTPGTMALAPDDDGLFRIDLRSGRADLLLSLATVDRALPCPTAAGQARWFEHVLFNTDGSRFLVLCRITQTDRRFLDSLWVADADGRRLECLIEYGHVISHLAWLDANTIMVSCTVLGQMQFTTLDVTTKRMQAMPIPAFPPDGHQACSPDFRWIVCDTYPQGDERLCSLFLHDRQRQETHVLGRFAHAAQFQQDHRCDLHPRWSGDGTRITFDSVHEGDRQIYQADVSDFIRRSE